MYTYIYAHVCACLNPQINALIDIGVARVFTDPLTPTPWPCLARGRPLRKSLMMCFVPECSRYRCQVGVKQNKHLNIKFYIVSVFLQSTSQLSSSSIFVLSRLDLPNIQQPSSINIWWILSSNWIATKTSGRSACSESTSMGGNLGINVHCVVFTNSSSWKSHTEQTEFPTAPTNDVLVHLPSAEGRWENSCSDLVDWCGPTNECGAAFTQCGAWDEERHHFEKKLLRCFLSTFHGTHAKPIWSGWWSGWVLNYRCHPQLRKAKKDIWLKLLHPTL